jgi:hypothetical protein
MATATPDSSASMFEALPRSVRQLLLVSAERAFVLANEALERLIARPAMTPSAAAEWHAQILEERRASSRPGTRSRRPISAPPAGSPSRRS